jgi:dipeptidyl aminopeptidase/acylaminoacyl peptidase
MICIPARNRKHFVALAFPLAALPTFAQKRAFTIEDFYRVRNASDLDVARDGSRFVFTVTTSSLPQAKRSTSIWISDANGAHSRQLTRVDADKSAHFSPDGKSIAFIRDNNLWILPLEAGEARQVTSTSTGVRSGRRTSG